MDYEKTGALIQYLRKEKRLTQAKLAEILNISDRTVSKWERGMGFPDISLIPKISEVFGVDIEKIIEGEIKPNDFIGGNMKKTKFYVCPHCGNIVMSTGVAAVSCCGRKVEETPLKKASDDEKLKVEKIDNKVYVSSSHPMTKEHYISFVAAATGDSLLVVKRYPEWDLGCYLGSFRHGMIIWYCIKDGLFYMNV